MKQIMKSVDRAFLDWCKLLKYFYERKLQDNSKRIKLKK